MAYKRDVAIYGAKELERKLRALPKKVAGKVIRKAVRAGSKVIKVQVVANAPRDEGTLAKSIKVRAAKRRHKGSVGMVVQTAEGDYKGETFYGAMVHQGHKIGKRATNASIGLRKRKRRTVNDRFDIQDKNDSRTEVPANPFMSKAFDSKKDEAAKVIVDTIKTGIEQEAKRA